MNIFFVLAFVLNALFGTVCAQNGTAYSTTTATLTKTVYHTKTVMVDFMTALPAAFGIGSSAGTGGDEDISIELKSVYVQTVGMTSTIYSTQINGVIVTTMFTILATSTSTHVEEVTSTSTMKVDTTITSTSIAVPAATSHKSIAQEIAQMYGYDSNGGDSGKAGFWLVFSVVLLCFSHYLFFAHH